MLLVLVLLCGDKRFQLVLPKYKERFVLLINYKVLDGTPLVD